MNQNTPMRPRRGRPPKPEGQRQVIRDQLLSCGVATLTEKGFAAVGIDEILRAAGVPKGSFYYYFDSKEAFGTALIAAYGTYFARKLDRCFGDETRPPLARLAAFVEEAKAGMARFNYRRGCLIGNLGQEMGALPESFRAQLGAVFDDWQARTAACLRAAQAQREIPAGEDCDRLAKMFWIGWEGAVLRAKLERSAEPLDIFAQGFLSALRVQRLQTGEMQCSRES